MSQSFFVILEWASAIFFSEFNHEIPSFTIFSLVTSLSVCLISPNQRQNVSVASTITDLLHFCRINLVLYCAVQGFFQSRLSCQVRVDVQGLKNKG